MMELRRSIRKRDTRSSISSQNIKSNLSKVNKIKILHLKSYQPTPEKGTPKRRKESTASSEESDREQYEVHETDESQEVDAINLSKRRCSRTKKTTRWGDTTELDFLNDSYWTMNPSKKETSCKRRIFLPTKGHHTRSCFSNSKHYPVLQPHPEETTRATTNILHNDQMGTTSGNVNARFAEDQQ